MGNDRVLVGFDLSRHAVMAVCREGKRRVRVSLDSIEFPEFTPVEQRWLQAWERFSGEAH